MMIFSLFLNEFFVIFNDVLRGKERENKCSEEQNVLELKFGICNIRMDYKSASTRKKLCLTF